MPFRHSELGFTVLCLTAMATHHVGSFVHDFWSLFSGYIRTTVSDKHAITMFVIAHPGTIIPSFTRRIQRLAYSKLSLRSYFKYYLTIPVLARGDIDCPFRRETRRTFLGIIKVIEPQPLKFLDPLVLVV